MYLTTNNIVPYLLQKGIMSRSELLHTDWFVSQTDSRKPVLRVVSVDQCGWIVKQPSIRDRHQISLLDREAAIFQLANNMSWARCLKNLMPRFRFYDPGIHALIVEYLPHDTGLIHLRRVLTQPRAMGGRLGRALASVHIAKHKCSSSGDFLSERLPWVFQIDSAQSSEMRSIPEEQVVKIIQNDHQLVSALVRLRREWRYETLIHGDAKLDNVIVRSGNRLRDWFVDWAFSGIGDPAWDVGTILHSCLLLWLQGVPFKREQSLSDGLRKATLALTIVQTFAREFLSAYRRVRMLRGNLAAAFSRRMSMFAGAALVQSAVAAARVQKVMTQRQLAAIQMGSNIICDPDTNLRELLCDE